MGMGRHKDKIRLLFFPIFPGGKLGNVDFRKKRVESGQFEKRT